MKKKIVEKQPEPSLLEKSIDVFKKIDLAEKRRALKTIRKAWVEGNVLDAAEPIAGMTAELFCTLYLLNRKQRPSKRKLKLDGILPSTDQTPIPT
jgi:hypothetical protein